MGKSYEAPYCLKELPGPLEVAPISPNHMPFVKVSHKACTLKTYFFLKYLAKYSWKYTDTVNIA